jgi:hypothetical protein
VPDSRDVLVGGPVVGDQPGLRRDGAEHERVAPSVVGRAAERRISADYNAGSITPATLTATWSCSSNTSSSEPSKRSAHRCEPLDASIS